MNFLSHFLLVAVLFAAVDSIWIGLVANKFYKKQLGSLLRPKPAFAPAVLFYVLYVAAMVVLVINPALVEDSLQKALGYGALFGLASYAAYDLTNASTLKNWPKAVTIIDLLWGTFVTAVVCGISFAILQ